MNFDNLVEDAGECWHVNSYRFTEPQLKELITQYIEADRAQGQEPVGYIGDGYFSTKEHLLREGWREDEIEAVYTRVQPTPAQIAELRNEKEALRKGFSECFTLWMDGANPNNHALAIHRFQDILCNAVLNANDEEIMKDEPL